MSRRTTRLMALIVSALAVVLLAPIALAAEPEAERAEYTERAEPICKTNVLANKQIFKGVKGLVKAGKLKQAAAHFSRAATAFGKTIGQLAAVPRPPADQVTLNKWLSLLRTEKGLIQKIGKALAAENKHKAEAISVELNHNSNKANNSVLAFEFDYCRIEPSRFG